MKVLHVVIRLGVVRARREWEQHHTQILEEGSE